MGYVVKYGKDCFKDAQYVRTKVFMEEQGYQDEFDEVDEFCVHVVAYDEDWPVGCARVFAESDNPTCFYIGRVAVLMSSRKQGIGRILVEKCKDVAIEGGASEIVLHAQARLEGWYGSMGYSRFREVDFEDEGQPHVWMKQVI